MSDLVAWLTKILDEDEAKFDQACEVEAAYCRSDGIPDMTAEQVKKYWLSLGDQTDWPWKLTDIAAKRAIIALHSGDNDEACQSYAGNWAYEPCPTLRLVASIYAERPGYDATWKP